MHLPPPILFLSRPVLVAAILLAAWGLGRTLRRARGGTGPAPALSDLFDGLVLTVFLLFGLGLAGGFHPAAAWALLGTGLLAAAWHARGLARPAAGLAAALHRHPWIAFACSPALALLFLRASAPPYFIDACQYHLAVCDVYIQAGGFTPHPDYFLASSHTTFVPESLYLLAMLLEGDMTAGLLGLSFALLALLQLRRLLGLLGAPGAFPVLLPALLGCGALFSSAVYAKTEPLVAFLLLEFLCRWAAGRRPVALGFGLGVLAAAKLSMLPVAAALGVAVAWRCAATTRSARPLAALLAGAALPPLLVVARNLATHGMPFYPFLPDHALVPAAQFAMLAWDPHTLAARLSANLADLLAGWRPRYFAPFLSAWILLLAACFPPQRHRQAFTGLLLLAAGNWLFLTCCYVLPDVAFRLSLPVVLAAFAATGLAVENPGRVLLRRAVLALGLASLLLLLAREGRLLPGLRFHLGREDLAAYHDGLGQHFGALGSSAVYRDLRPEGRIAVIGEHLHLGRHPRALYVNMSRGLESATGADGFLAALAARRVEWLLVEKGCEKVLRPLGAIPSCLADGRLVLEAENRGARLLRVASRPPLSTTPAP